MNSSCPSCPSTENLMSSNSTPGTESNFSSANPPSSPMDSRPGNESGFSSANPPLTLVCSGCRPGNERGSPYTNPSPLMYPSSFCMAGVETTYSMSYPPPYGTCYAPTTTYYGSSQPGPVLNYGVPYPGQPSYYPPPPPYYNFVYDVPSENKRNNCCLRRLVTIIIILIVCISIITLSLNFIYKPEYPSVSLISATVYSLSTSSSNSTISSDFSLTFSIKNPNKRMDIFYHYVYVSVLFGLDTITSNRQPDFLQNSKAGTSNMARLTGVDMVVSASTIKGINDDLVNGRPVNFRVRLDAAMRFNRMRLFERLLWVECPDVNIQFVNLTTGDGKTVGPPISCDVDK